MLVINVLGYQRAWARMRPNSGRAAPLLAARLHWHSDSCQPAVRPVEAQIAPRILLLRLSPLSRRGDQFAAIASSPRSDVTSFTSIGRQLGYVWATARLMGQAWRSQMTAIARVLSRVSGTQIDVEILKTIAMFCGVGLTVYLLLASYGLDLSPGFF